MSATSKDIITPELKVIDSVNALDLPAETGAVGLAGTIACFNSSGNYVPATTATGLTCAGRLEEAVDNSAGSAGDKRAKVKPGVFGFTSADIDGDANRGAVAYLVDNQTVSISDAGGTRSKAGVIQGKDAATGKIFVAMGFALFSSPAATPAGTFAKRTVTLDDTITGSADTNGTANTPINVGAALPAGAVLVGIELVLATPAAGGSVSAALLDVGFAGDTEAIVKDFDALGSSAGTYDGVAASGSAPSKALPLVASGKQLQAIVTPDGGHKLSALTAFGLTINAYYFVAF